MRQGLASTDHRRVNDRRIRQAPMITSGTNTASANSRHDHILAHVRRNRITTPEALHRLFFQGATRNSVTQCTTALVESEYLNRHPLFGKRTYFTLGRRAVRKWNISPRRTQALGKQALATEFATLAYCCLQEHVRKRLLPHEIKQHFPWFPDHHMHRPYYLDHGDGARHLATIRVELSDSAQHIVRKHSQELYNYRNIIEFRRLIDLGQFVLVIITASAHMRDQIRDELDCAGWFVPSCVLDYPELIHFCHQKELDHGPS